MTQVKFYRVETLPEVGEVGSLYFVYKGASPKFYVCTTNGFEQYSDLFNRDFATLLVDAIANAGDGVVYFTPDTCEIIKDGVKYGGAHLADCATKQWVEDKGYLTEHQDISGKVDVLTFEDANNAVSESIDSLNDNKLNRTDDSLLTTDKTIVGAINEVSKYMGKYPLVEHLVSDAELVPGSYHMWPAGIGILPSNISFSIPEELAAFEFVFQFTVAPADAVPSLVFDIDILWVNDEEPTWEAGWTYEISIIHTGFGLASYTKYPYQI